MALQTKTTVFVHDGTSYICSGPEVWCQRGYHEWEPPESVKALCLKLRQTQITLSRVFEERDQALQSQRETELKLTKLKKKGKGGRSAKRSK